jgi:hypothetical protein
MPFIVPRKPNFDNRLTVKLKKTAALTHEKRRTVVHNPVDKM